MASKQYTFEDAYTPEPNTGCWLWTRGTTTKGYGAYWFQQRKEKAHRASWIIHFGKIPDKMFVCHKCDTPACVNPSHLFLGTNKDNMRDAGLKGRLHHSNTTHCTHGHELAGDNLYIPPKRPNCKHCKSCSRNASARFRERKLLCRQ